MLYQGRGNEWILESHVPYWDIDFRFLSSSLCHFLSLRTLLPPKNILDTGSSSRSPITQSRVSPPRFSHHAHQRKNRHRALPSYASFSYWRKLIAISTPSILLVPYEASHVPTYHEWMKDPVCQLAMFHEQDVFWPTIHRTFRLWRRQNHFR